MNKDYKGIIIEESLEDNRVLNDIHVVNFKISNDENPSDRWHLYTVSVSKDEIQKLSKYIRSGTWYMHFWKDKHIIAIFKDKIFEFDYDDKSTWKDAVSYGLSQGIPEGQLNFLIS